MVYPREREREISKKINANVKGLPPCSTCHEKLSKPARGKHTHFLGTREISFKVAILLLTTKIEATDNFTLGKDQSAMAMVLSVKKARNLLW